MQRTESLCLCQGCGHLRELHAVEGGNETLGVLRLRSKCRSRGCECAHFSGELWRKWKFSAAES